MKHFLGSLVVSFSLIPAVWAADPPAAEHTIFATVNGVPLSRSMYEFLRQARASEENDEQADAALFDDLLRDQQAAKDLVMTELLSQQAVSLGLDQSPSFQLEMEMARKTLLAQLYIQRLLQDMNVDEEVVRQVYEQQSPQILYRFMIWRTRDPEQALRMLENLQGGQALADADVGPGLGVIETPWLRDRDIEPEVNALVQQLDVGAFVGEPILQDGVWKVVQVIDRQLLAKRSFAEERDVISAELKRVELDRRLESLTLNSSIIFE